MHPSRPKGFSFHFKVSFPPCQESGERGGVIISPAVRSGTADQAEPITQTQLDGGFIVLKKKTKTHRYISNIILLQTGALTCSTRPPPSPSTCGSKCRTGTDRHGSARKNKVIICEASAPTQCGNISSCKVQIFVLLHFQKGKNNKNESAVFGQTFPPNNSNGGTMLNIHGCVMFAKWKTHRWTAVNQPRFTCRLVGLSRKRRIYWRVFE